MSSLIGDGKGRGFLAEVDASQKLQTRSVRLTEQTEAALNGDAYNINTSTITLTSANASGVFYMQNNDTKLFIITSFFYLLGSSTGGSGDILVEVIANSTGGTVDTGADFDAVNRNFGSTQTPTATIKRGFEGATVTGGLVAIESLILSSGRYPIPVDALILTNGDKCAVRITPPAGNTSMNIQVAVAGYVREV